MPARAGGNSRAGCPQLLRSGAVVVLSLLAAGLLQAAESESVIALVGGSVVDLDGSAPLHDAVVLVRGERIAAVGTAAEVQVPAEAERFDVGGAWLIPGLMNMHVHFGLALPGRMAAELANETDGELALRVAANARQSLAAGVTTVRSPGSSWPPRFPGRADLALAKAIARGEVHGPRIYSAGEALVITGGHGSAPGNAYSDGPYELMKAARSEISAGASWVKIMISGGIATEGGGLAEALMTPEEIRAVVDAAHRFGAQVAAHSGSAAATAIAVEAGVDSIEHGYFLDRPVLKQMAKAGTWFVPTMVVSQPASRPFFEMIGSPPWYLERLESVGREHWRVLQMAIEEGVSIALGTDQMPGEPNDGTTATAREAQYYVEAGMTPLAALRSATIETARMLRADDELGSLEPGKYADIVAVAGNPAEDITALRSIKLVMKGGTVYRNDMGR